MSERSESFARLRVAVVGYGSIGRRHCQNLATFGVGRRVVVRRQKAANPAFTPPGDVSVVHSVSQSIDSGIDLAIICNPTSLHIATAREYLAAGVPVLIEKPLADSLTEAESFAREAEAAGSTIGMAYCMRYHPAYALARKTTAEGRIGHMIQAKAWFESYLPDWHPWEDYRQSYAARHDLGGGVLPTLDHELDFINWCFGSPAAVSGEVWRSSSLDLDVDDSAHIKMDYPGYSVEVSLSFARRDRRRGFEFIGSEARLRFLFEDQCLTLSGDGSKSDQILWHEPDYDINQTYVGMLADFLEAVANGRPMPVPLRAGVEALGIANYRACPRTN